MKRIVIEAESMQWAAWKAYVVHALGRRGHRLDPRSICEDVWTRWRVLWGMGLTPDDGAEDWISSLSLKARADALRALQADAQVYDRAPRTRLQAEAAIERFNAMGRA